MSRDAVRLRAVKVTVECFITRSLEAYESLYYFWRLFPVIFSAWLVHGFFLHFACRMHSFIACLDPYAGLVRFWFCVIATLTFFFFFIHSVFIYIVACEVATWHRVDAQTRPTGQKVFERNNNKEIVHSVVECRKESIIDRNGHMQYIHTSTCFDFEHAETAKMAADLQLLTEPWQWQQRWYSIRRFEPNFTADWTGTTASWDTRGEDWINNCVQSISHTWNILVFGHFKIDDCVSFAKVFINQSLAYFYVHEHQNVSHFQVGHL